MPYWQPLGFQARDDLSTQTEEERKIGRWDQKLYQRRTKVLQFTKFAVSSTSAIGRKQTLDFVELGEFERPLMRKADIWLEPGKIGSPDVSLTPETGH